MESFQTPGRKGVTVLQECLQRKMRGELFDDLKPYLSFRGLRWGKYKLIKNYPNDNLGFYDVRHDYEEKENLIGKRGIPVKEEMLKELREIEKKDGVKEDIEFSKKDIQLDVISRLKRLGYLG